MEEMKKIYIRKCQEIKGTKKSSGTELKIKSKKTKINFSGRCNPKNPKAS